MLTSGYQPKGHTMKLSTAVFASILSLSVSAMADITLTNGADLDMNGSAGSTIIFQDGSTQNTSSSTNPIPAGHGGTNNTVTGTDAFVGGGFGNTASGSRSTVGGGKDNTASGYVSTVGGGYTNTASDFYATVGGGDGNQASGYYATVAGGDDNTASGTDSTVGGGFDNTASGTRSTVGGGSSNAASNTYATVGGGSNNTASGTRSTVGGGSNNTASGTDSTVAGGRNNTASGDYSFAAGRSTNDGGYNNSFVWGGATGARTSAGADTFNVWSAGGIYLNGSVHAASDKNLKEGFSFVSGREVLDKVVEMPISKWRFKSEDDDVKHIGPVAQDFMASFGYGSSDKHITSTDADGVALAAIQGLNEKLEANLEVTRGELAQKQAEIDRLEAELEKQREEDNARDEQFASLEERLLAMEASMK